MRILYIASLAGVLIGLFMEWFSIEFWSWNGLQHWSGFFVGLTTVLTLSLFLTIQRQHVVRFLTVLIPLFVILQWIFYVPLVPGAGMNLGAGMEITSYGFYFTLVSALVALVAHIRYSRT
ncbi:hypothetical protein SAMN05192559_1079 [Halobacillus karajensis]|uniref:hypothetical protein n=1 Tax=Halobacillus karajensis TaxID=195088 RepID=UPI0008A7BE6C|nr:hypothetical protein [Halobacillus karajensis]SEI00048.1 hypothetical protein SAMN05192559_1079 [Halobacillus karajensis]